MPGFCIFHFPYCVIGCFWKFVNFNHSFLSRKKPETTYIVILTRVARPIRNIYVNFVLWTGYIHIILLTRARKILALSLMVISVHSRSLYPSAKACFTILLLKTLIPYPRHDHTSPGLIRRSFFSCWSFIVFYCIILFSLRPAQQLCGFAADISLMITSWKRNYFP